MKKILFCILKVTEESSRIQNWIRSARKCHGSTTLIETIVLCVCAQENHMRSVMMCVLEGGGGAAAEGEEQLVERSAEQAKLGVNLLLFAGSR
jgi:hypothetical protein